MQDAGCWRHRAESPSEIVLTQFHGASRGQKTIADLKARMQDAGFRIQAFIIFKGVEGVKLHLLRACSQRVTAGLD
jgi:hypothetical protein